MNTFAPILAASNNDDQSPEAEWEVIEGDALEKLDSVRDASCKLIVTSPPYNIGKE